MSKGNRINHPRRYARDEDLKAVREDVETIRDNHLPTIWRQLSGIQGQLKILVPLVIAILGLILAIVFGVGK